MVHEGESLDVLYFISHGSFEVKQDGRVVGLLGTKCVVNCSVYLEGFFVQSRVLLHSIALFKMLFDYFVLHSVSGQDDVFGDDVCNEVTVGKSIADVYALTYSDIHCIDRNDLRDVLMMYPESGVEFSTKLKLTFNLRHQV